MPFHLAALQASNEFGKDDTDVLLLLLTFRTDVLTYVNDESLLPTLLYHSLLLHHCLNSRPKSKFSCKTNLNTYPF